MESDNMKAACSDAIIVRLMEENERLKELINDLYPAIAGLVIAAHKTGETNTEKMWNAFCKRMIEFQPKTGRSDN